MHRLILLLSLFTINLPCALTQDGDANWDYLITDVRVLGSDAVLEHVDVAISDGLIKEIGTKLSANGTATEMIDGSGKTLLPGLINAHVHAWFPGHLQQAAQAGVLTVMDMHGSAYAMEWLRGFADSTGYAHYLSASSGATVPEGHGTQFGLPIPTIDSSLSAYQYAMDRVNEGVDYIKILREPSRPTVSFEQIDTIIRTAHAHDVKVVAHVSRRDDAIRLAELGIDGLVHIWFDEPMTDEQIQTMAGHDLFIIPTTLTNVLLIDFFIEKEVEIETMDKETLLGDIKRLHDAGVTILAGTDPPNFEINYGTDLYKEIYLLVEAGLSPEEAIRAASSASARAFDLGESHEITSGNRASFLLIDGDPISQIEDLEKVVMVWQHGKVIMN